MGLVAEIRDDAVRPDVPTSVLLRKCLVLASRLGHQPLMEWVQYELNGYPDDAPLPSYRGPHALTPMAHLAGPFRSEVRNLQVPIGAIPEYAREWLKHETREALAGLEHTVRQAESKGLGSLRVHLPADLAPQVEIYEGHTTVQLWLEIPLSLGVAILDQVRNRVLNFALEIEKEDPRAGEAEIGSQPIPEDRVAQIFNVVVMGGEHSWSLGSSGQTIQLIEANVQPGELKSLVEFLRGQGLPESQIKELEQALEEDGSITGAEPGPQTKGWLRRTADKAGEVGSSVAAGVITAALNRYLGLS